MFRTVWMDKENLGNNQQRSLSPMIQSDDEEDFLGFSDESLFEADKSKISSLNSLASAEASTANPNDTLRRIKQLKMRADTHAKRFMRLYDYSMDKFTPNSTNVSSSFQEQPIAWVPESSSVFRQPFSPLMSRRARPKAAPMPIKPSVAAASTSLVSDLDESDSFQEEFVNVIDGNDNPIQSGMDSGKSSLSSWYNLNADKQHSTLSSDLTTAGETSEPWKMKAGPSNQVHGHAMITTTDAGRQSGSSDLSSWFNLNADKRNSTLSSSLTSAGETSEFGPWKIPTYGPSALSLAAGPSKVNTIVDGQSPRRSSVFGPWFEFDTTSSTTSSPSSAGEPLRFRPWQAPIVSPPSPSPISAMQRPLPRIPIPIPTVVNSPLSAMMPGPSDPAHRSQSFRIHADYNDLSSSMSSTTTTGDSFGLNPFEMPAVPEAAARILDFEIPIEWINQRKGYVYVRCDRCKLFFRRLAALNGHAKMKPNCGDDGLTKKALANRLKGKPVEVCSVCERKFTSKIQLRSHTNIHLRAKDYVV